MGNKQTRRKASKAQERREAIIDVLGRKCANPFGDCLTPFHELELDHINGRDWDVTKFSQMGRVRRYEKEAKLGLLQVLCTSCNKRKQ